MPMLNATCDGCGIYGESDVYRERLLYRLRLGGWAEQGDRLLCPKCSGSEPRSIPSIEEALAAASDEVTAAAKAI